jgi:predicted component of type VI protein secretion system
MEKNKVYSVLYIGGKIIENISKEDYVMWREYGHSEDSAIVNMVKQIILEKYGYGRNDIKRNEIKYF